MSYQMPQHIYMDYAASTPLDPHVADVMAPLLGHFPGNASSMQNPHGQTAKRVVDKAREQIAQVIGALPEEIFFTSGATEANNLALFGISEYLKQQGTPDIVSSRTEHASVLMPLAQMQRDGHSVAFSKLLPCGMADGPFVFNEVTVQTGLISIQAVNNETGVINPLDEIRDGIKNTDVIFHVDAAQALGKIPFNVSDLGVDMATLSAHKVYGPQGVGALYIRKDLQRHIIPMMHGGGQQGMIRPGTLPVALIAGFGEACCIAADYLPEERQRLENLNALLRTELDNAGTEYKINGHDYGDDSRNWRVPNIMNIRFPDIENEWLLEAVEGVSFSTGSACSAHGNKPSHVLDAMGLSRQESIESVRLSFGRFTTDEDIKQVAQSFVTAINVITALADAA